MSVMNAALVAHIAILASIPVSPEEDTKLATGFDTTLKVVDQLMDVDTSTVEPTHQVTGLENIVREDVVEPKRMFTQEEALANAKRTYQGMFVVPQLIGE